MIDEEKRSKDQHDKGDRANDEQKGENEVDENDAQIVKEQVCRRFS